jgi:hypothetical protein
MDSNVSGVSFALIFFAIVQAIDAAAHTKIATSPPALAHRGKATG